MILLDTHPLIWFTQGETKLGTRARRLLSESFAARQAMVSPITFWEASMLANKGRIVLALAIKEWVNEVIKGGVSLVPVSPEIAVAAGQLRGDIHGDPADRIIIATAQLLASPVVTADRKILDYAAEGHVQAIDARL